MADLCSTPLRWGWDFDSVSHGLRSGRLAAGCASRMPGVLRPCWANHKPDRSLALAARSLLESTRNHPQGDSNPCLQDENLKPQRRNSCNSETYDGSSAGLVSCLACAEACSPELAAVIAVWADLPEHVRRTIVTLVEAAIQS